MNREIIAKNTLKGNPVGYLQFSPETRIPKGLPVIVIMHGRGEGGKDAGSVHALEKYAEKKNHAPWIIQNSAYIQSLQVVILCTHMYKGFLELQMKGLLEHIHEVYQPSGIALTGYSQGAKNVLEAIEDEACRKLFNVAVPLSTPKDLKGVIDVGEMAVWSLIGWNDETRMHNAKNMEFLTGAPNKMRKDVPRIKDNQSPEIDITVAYSLGLRKWIRIPITTSDKNCQFVATFYANRGHSIQDEVYNTPQVWEWMIAHCKGGDGEIPEEPKNPFADFTDPELLMAERVLEIGANSFSPIAADEKLLENVRKEIIQRIGPKLKELLRYE